MNVDLANSLLPFFVRGLNKTTRPEVLTPLGGFNSILSIPKQFKEPCLVVSTDGVGTKLKLASDQKNVSKIGIDLVAMSVNDVLVSGATPYFFLDYIATGKLTPSFIEDLMSGIIEGCKISNISLVGGETAEMPGLYQGTDFDISGVCLGFVEKDLIVSGCSVQPGDVILGLPSSGVHSNGFSLVREILKQVTVDQEVIDFLLTPTKIYTDSILTLLKREIRIKSMAHITGGGFTNISRTIPPTCSVKINPSSWVPHSIFGFIQSLGSVSDEEMRKTFNCGIGFTLVVDKSDVQPIKEIFYELNEPVFEIGWVEEGSGTIEFV